MSLGISTVDPEARHGHKSASRGFDGYKGHIAIDPDSEIITATEVTAGNVGDAVSVHPKHRVLDRARKRQRDPDGQARYRATRPKGRTQDRSPDAP